MDIFYYQICHTTYLCNNNAKRDLSTDCIITSRARISHVALLTKGQEDEVVIGFVFLY